MNIVVYVLAAAAVVSWLMSAVSAADLVKNHRTDDRSISTYGAHGHLFFSAANFAPSGAAAHRRCMMGLFGFIISGAAAVLLVVLLSAP